VGPENDLTAGSIEAAFAALASTRTGLTSDEAARRADTYGPNRIEARRRQRFIVDLLKRFRNPLVLVLLAAAALSAATGDPASFGIIVTVVVLSVLLDFFQERRALGAAEKLREQVAVRVSALRDARMQDVPATAVVPGDVVVLSAGDLVPGDCRLVEAKDLFVNEALLTGESYPAEKLAQDLTGAQGENAAKAAVFMGSSVLSGTAKALVIRTGLNTELGAVARSLNREPPLTAFGIGIRDFGFFIVRLTLLMVFFVLIVNVLFHRPVLESLLFALALAVGLTPELLPMIVSVTLAHGALRMAKKRAIVKRLSAIHDLGSMNVLCSDKTGTLTEARIAVVRELDISGAESREVLKYAYLNAVFESGLKSPLDTAILETKAIPLEGWTKIDEVPFDFERRRVSVLVERDGTRQLIVKGSPEDVLKLASRYSRASQAIPLALDSAARLMAMRAIADLGRQGFRVLGVALRDVGPGREHAGLEDESDLVFAGLVAFRDPPKESAAGTLASLGRLGVELKIVTGDSEEVTRHVCNALGIPVSNVVTGSDLQSLTDEALSARVESTNLFCRVNPTQKARVIRALRSRGHIVGYLGDGINDAPSLHAADVGLSVDGAVDVAKEAAAIILLETDLHIVADGVVEGRRTNANIMKYVMMGTSSNFGNMFSMAGGVLLLPFLPMLPVQILLNNLLYDISEIAIPMDAVDEEMVSQPRRWDIGFVRRFMLVLGPISSLFDFLTFALLLVVFDAGETLFHTGWFVESLMTQVLVIFVIRTRRNPLRSRPCPLLAASSALVVAAAAGLPYTAVGGWFGLVPLQAPLLFALAGMTAAYLIATTYAKRWFYARFPGS
jgi:P-type Mg2+ transporter